MTAGIKFETEPLTVRDVHVIILLAEVKDLEKFVIKIN